MGQMQVSEKRSFVPVVLEGRWENGRTVAAGSKAGCGFNK